VLGGLAYASAAYIAIVHAPGWFRRFVDRAADPELASTVAAAEGGDAVAAGQLRGRIPWRALRPGLLVAGVGAIGVALMGLGNVLGGMNSPLFLVPWAFVIGGLVRAATRLFAEPTGR
jgi:hypothetical protein